MPTTGWFGNVNNIAYLEALGGSASFDAYRVDLKTFWKHGGASRSRGAAIQLADQRCALRPHKPRSTFAATNKANTSRRTCRRSKSKNASRSTPRWGATIFAGAAGLYGEGPVPLERSLYPVIGAGLQFVLKPAQRMNVNLEYAQGIDDNRGVYVKLGYAW